MRLRVIDIETNGGRPSEIIEIAAVDVVDSAPGWIAERPRTTLFRPRGQITVHAMAIHHLTLAHLGEATGPCSDDVLGEFISTGEHPNALVAHNASFESQHITTKVTRDLDWICTVKAARMAWPDAPGYSNQVLRYWRNLNLSLDMAMPPHRAGPDAWVTAHILIDLLRTASVEDLLIWSKVPRVLNHVPFGRYRGQSWTVPPSHYLHWMISEPDMAEDVVMRARNELSFRGAAT